VTDILTDILVILGILAAAAALVLIGLMLTGVFGAGPLAAWWAHGRG
jgi:hypothetical protein